MRKFKYTAVSQDGIRQRGVVAAAGEDRAVVLLRSKGLIVTDISEERRFSINTLFSKLKKVSPIDKIVFTRQLSVMLETGIPIIRSLNVLHEQARDPYFAGVIKEVVEEIEGGTSLYNAMAKHLDVFDELYLSLVNAGEKSGNLVKVLDRLTETMQRDYDFSRKTKGAMIYPAVIVVVMVGVVVLMLLFVIPKLESLYEEMEAVLPVSTRILLAASSIFVSFWWAILLVLIGAVYALRKYAETEQGQFVMSKIQLKTPIFGLLAKQVQLTSFSRTLGMLIASGLPIIQSLEISSKTMPNRILQTGAGEATKAVERGESLGEELTRHPTFPSIFSEMIKVGEQSGRLDDVLDDLSRYFENESLRTVDNLASLLEPIIMVVLAIGVGILVISLIMPIYSLTSQF